MEATNKNGNNPSLRQIRPKPERYLLPTRTAQTASEMKPQLKKLTTDVSARENFHNTRACEILLSVADKANITPEIFAKMGNKNPEPAQTTNNTQGILKTAQNMFEKRGGRGGPIGEKSTE